jgi:hypothetical protein
MMSPEPGETDIVGFRSNWEKAFFIQAAGLFDHPPHRRVSSVLETGSYTRFIGRSHLTLDSAVASEEFEET